MAEIPRCGSSARSGVAVGEKRSEVKQSHSSKWSARIDENVGV